MGTIRTLLALAVVFAHCYGFVFTGGMLAVQIFYVISGYLMSLILLSDNDYIDIKKFYLNRALRLMPIYWFVALASLGFNIFLNIQGEDRFFYIFSEIDEWAKVLSIFSNIFIIGQDVIVFTGVIDGDFGFLTDLSKSELNVGDGLLVPQSWTLALEISFYLIAPFILRSPKVWMLILAGSLFIKFYLVYLGIGTTDPFSYRFFPAELSLFLLGSFSHQYLQPLYMKKGFLSQRTLPVFITSFSIAIILFYSFLPQYKSFVLALIMIAYMVLVIPFLAHFQKIFYFDNWIGNLSYPIYISHFLVIWIVNYFAFHYGFFQTFSYYASILVGTLIFSYGLEQLINKRINLLREIIRGKK
jgi:peptidoglycan/LPS O-acetylase OafA/YrhL